METNAVTEWMQPPVRTEISLKIQYAVGLTEKGHTKHRTNTVPYIRPDVTNEEIVTAIDAIRPGMQYPITDVRLIVKKTKQILGPMEYKEKHVAEDKFEGSVAVMNARTTTASQASASSMQTSAQQQTSNFAAQMPTTPTQVYTTPSILAEEPHVPVAEQIGMTEKKSLWQRVHEFLIDDSYLNKTAEETTAPVLEQIESPVVPAAPQATAPDYSLLLKSVQEAKASTPNFLEQLRQNNFQISGEEMSRNPLQGTTAIIGYEPPVTVYDGPIYCEQME